MRAPIRVTPLITTWERSRTPSSSTARGPDMTEGTDLDVRAELRAVFNHRCRMNRHRAFRAVMDHRAELGLGAQRVADKGLAAKRQTGPRRRIALTGMRSMSPGRTGLRKRAFSMVMK